MGKERDDYNGNESRSINFDTFGVDLSKLKTTIKPKPVNGQGKLFRLIDEDRDLQYAVSSVGCNITKSKPRGIAEVG
jgi:hypothetical protein